jgi:hypothetical protein
VELQERDNVPLLRTIQGLSFRAETHLAGAEGQLRTEVIVRNLNEQPVGLEYDHCSLYLRAYRFAHRSGRAVWDERYLPDYDPKINALLRVCDLVGYPLIRLPPGDSVRFTNFQLSPTVGEILGDSLPKGRYYFVARLGVNKDTVLIDAGSLNLSR